MIAARSQDAALKPTNGAADLMCSLMRYKAWADADLLDAVLALPLLVTSHEGPYVATIIRHFYTVDCIFRAHLLGIPHGYGSTNPTEPATLPELQQHVRGLDEWYVEYASQLDEGTLSQTLDVEFTDGQRQVLSRSDILLHVSLHGAYHRGNVGLLLRKGGAPAPPDRFTSYLQRPVQRAR